MDMDVEPFDPGRAESVFAEGPIGLMSDDELLLQVFRFLGPTAKEMSILSVTCRRFRKAVQKDENRLWRAAFELNKFQVDSLDRYQLNWRLRYKGHTVQGRLWISAVDKLIEFTREAASGSIVVRDPEWATVSIPLLTTVINFEKIGRLEQLPHTFQRREKEKFLDLILRKALIQPLMEILLYSEVLDPSFVSSVCGCAGSACPRIRNLRSKVAWYCRQTNILPLIKARHLLHVALLRNKAFQSTTTTRLCRLRGRS
mmetsp:Transcript_28888/g.50823  ORF Transcript_28888/g.50823 Transcript_28888/m.50823 type:complete len:257 (+) Transcript_28888:46-816(+)